MAIRKETSTRKRVMRIRRRPLASPAGTPMGIADFRGRQVFCALGRNGITAFKREGDGKTPLGRFAMLEARFRADRLKRQALAMPLAAITPAMGWCDAPGHRNYNRPVSLPFSESHETLWRADHLYDFLVVLDQNYSARMRGLGSAIFFHLAHEGWRGTEGCLAIARRHLALFAPGLNRNTVVEVAG